MEAQVRLKQCRETDINNAEMETERESAPVVAKPALGQHVPSAAAAPPVASPSGPPTVLFPSCAC